MIMRPDLQEHSLFSTIKRYIEYYDTLSFGLMGISDSPVLGLLNLDMYIIESQKNCLGSINEVLLLGHINDGYTLLRKYYDHFIINIFERIKINELQESFELVNKVIDNWVKGKSRLPTYTTMLKDVLNNKKIENYVTNNFFKSNLLKIRVRCDDHVHNNFFSYMQLNNDLVWLNKEKNHLTQFEKDITSIFCAHFLLLFEMAPHYMASSDYIDYLEAGMTPPDGCQYNVAPFIQDIYDNEICKWNIELANLFKDNCIMKLE